MLVIYLLCLEHIQQSRLIIDRTFYLILMFFSPIWLWTHWLNLFMNLWMVYTANTSRRMELYTLSLTAVPCDDTSIQHSCVGKYEFMVKLFLIDFCGTVSVKKWRYCFIWLIEVVKNRCSFETRAKNIDFFRKHVNLPLHFAATLDSRLFDICRTHIDGHFCLSS